MIEYDNENDIICAICLDSVLMDITETTCKHTYHKKCLNEWLVKSPTCPTCVHALTLVVDDVKDIILHNDPDPECIESEPYNFNDGLYFKYVEPYEHSTSTLSHNAYSFALYPEKNQPAGTLNFSRINDAMINDMMINEQEKSSIHGKFKLKFNHPVHELFWPVPAQIDHKPDTNINVYAKSYNIFKINDGVGYYRNKFMY